ncbi:type I secretion system permease/ATPase [Rhizobium sp. 2YAF20]|uniref:type I secretion system permease/ATPase n=1 Tax=Rhizobium sp. 2YAF20 TaxID=3233027 RepID=UPI003F9455DD
MRQRKAANANHHVERGASKDQPARVALRARMRDFRQVAVFSAAINILTLTGSFYMLQIYDRVLVSRSIETLVALSLVALVAFALQGALDSIRLRMLSRIGAQFDEDLSSLSFRAANLIPLRGGPAEQAMQPIRDLDLVRGFLAGPGPAAIFDLPFMPLFVVGCFILHPWLGWLAVGGGAVITLLAIATDHHLRDPVRRVGGTASARQVLADTARRNCETLEAMGMHDALDRRWRRLCREHIGVSLQTSDVHATLGSSAKIFRTILQSAILATGAYLVINQEVSGGAMIAASIMTSRALAPIETALANWKGLVAARSAYARLKVSLAVAVEHEVVELRRPRSSLMVQGLTIIRSDGDPILINVSFELKAGDALGIVGPSGCGKSSLARAIVGALAPMKGVVRLDRAALGQWDRGRLGRHIGYLPQDLGLIDGTIAEAISRFQVDDDADRIIDAATTAGAHDMILALPHGYDTRLGEGGILLSGGQRQRIGLARALYGDPFLVVLDEPNSNLDATGDMALTEAIESVRGRGGIAVVVTHRPSGLAAVNKVAFLQDAAIKLFGPKDEVMASLSRPVEVTPLRAVGGTSENA